MWRDPLLSEALLLEAMLALGVNPESAEEVDAGERHHNIVAFWQKHAESFFETSRPPIWGEVLTRLAGELILFTVTLCANPAH